MNCPFCQSENSAEAQFCGSCGAELRSAVPSLGQNRGATADALPIGTLLSGTYAVGSVLGQGGFGITYDCYDQMLERRVAIKEFFPFGSGREGAEVQPSRGLSGAHFGEARAQFLAEARALARCHHAGIVGVHTAFEANSTAYMVMELLHGSDLLQLLDARGGRLSETEAVPLIERAGQALQFVHDQGLLHRDIKPENIIATDDGRVMLIDFGTAREFVKGQAQGHTIVVTPGYAPLEQYARQAQRGAFTDVYGLAATLYHLLTGNQPPAASDRAMGVMLRPVRKENPQISRGVADAIETALQMEIAKRPQSVREFLELMHAPVTQAPRETAAFKIALAPPGNPISQENASSEEAALSQAQHDALLALSFAPANFFSGALQARQQMLEGVISQSPPVQLAPPSIIPSALVPSASSTLSSSAGGGFVTKNSARLDDDSIKTVQSFAGRVAGVLGLLVILPLIFGFLRNSRTTPDPSRSSSSYSSNYQSSVSSDSPVVTNVVTHETAEEAARREMESTPAILPVSVESLPGGIEPLTIDNSAMLSSLWGSGVAAFSPDGQRLAYVDMKAVVRVWSVSQRRVVSSLPSLLSERRIPRNLLFSGDGKSLVVTYQNYDARSPNQVREWNLRNEKAQGTLSNDPIKYWLAAQSVLPDGKVLMTKAPWPTPGNPSPTISNFLWDSTNGKQTPAPIWVNNNPIKIVVSPDGKQMVSGDIKGRIRWLDARSGVQLKEHLTNVTYRDLQASLFSEHTDFGGVNLADPLPVGGLRFSSDGSALASHNDMQTNVFDSKSQEIGTLNTRFSEVFAVSRDGNFVVTGGNLNDAERKMLWEVRQNQKFRLQSPEGRLSAVTFSRDGKQVIGICNSDGRASLVTWNTDAKPAAPFSAPHISGLPASSPFSHVPELSVAGQIMATPDGRSIELRRLDGTFLTELADDGLIGAGVTFSPDGQLLAAPLAQGKVQIWNVQSRQKVVQLEALAPPQPQNVSDSSLSSPRINGLVFSPDNTLLTRAVTVNQKNLVELWSLKNSPRRIASFPANPSFPTLQFSPDSRGLVYAESGKLRRYDVATQKLSAPFDSGSRLVSYLSFTPQGLAVAAWDKSVSTLTLYDLMNDSKSEKSSRNPLLSLKQKAMISLTRVHLDPTRMAISADGQFLAVVSYLDALTRGINVWHIPTGSLLQTLKCDSPTTQPVDFPAFRGVAFSPDGTQITCIREIMNIGNAGQPRQRQIITWQRPMSQ